jgi:hypothetical protein
MTLGYFDIRCGDDLDRFARDARPLEVLGQDVYHWLITDKGAIFRAPNWGGGLNSYISKPLPTTLAADIENGILDAFSDAISAAKCTIEPIAGEKDSYRFDLQCEVDDDFLTIALTLTPSGIVRVA